MKFAADGRLATRRVYVWKITTMSVIGKHFELNFGGNNFMPEAANDVVSDPAAE